MENHKKEAIIEAILFAMGEAVELSKLADAIDENVETTKKIIAGMVERYQEEDRGVTLVEFNTAIQMCTKAEMYEYLLKVAKSPRKYALSETLLETLSIIAYKQPVTKMDIERIRGVNCDHAVNRLVEYEFVTELGRMDAPGRPLLFGTTEQFLRSFGVKSIEELPELNQVQIEEFKIQAEQEVQLQLEI